MLGVITERAALHPVESPLSSPNTSNSSKTAGSPLHSPALPTNPAENVPFKVKFAKFFRKYFLEGQHLNNQHYLETKESAKLQPLKELNSPPPQYHLYNNTLEKPFYKKYRKYIGFLLPLLMMHLVWWPLAIRHNIFRLYPTRYELAVTMVLGATVAGMTSEGGGAIAFPVMTLLLKINPTVARDFSLMIQSCGMTSAAFTIVWMRIKVEWHSIIVCSAGATLGIVSGLEFVDQLFTGPQKKMLFVSIWFSFALSLFLLNAQKKRLTYEIIQNFNFWKGCVLFFTGFVGGLCSAFAGSGLDICSFSIITLLFRVSEKVATPTSGLFLCVYKKKGGHKNAIEKRRLFLKVV